MTSDKKRKQAVRARAKKTNMSYAATVNAESPYRVPGQPTSTTFSAYRVPGQPTSTTYSEYYVPPLAPNVLAQAFADIERLDQRVLRLRVNSQLCGELRKFARDVIDFVNTPARYNDGVVGQLWRATVHVDNSIEDHTFILDHEPSNTDESDNDLVIVVKAAKPIKGGVGDGQLQLRQPQIFMGGQQVGFIQRITFQAVANALMSHLEFEFPAEAVLSETSRAAVEQTIAQLRQAFPWVTIGRLTTTPTEVVNPQRTVTKFEDIRELFTAIVQKRDSTKGSSLVLPCDDPKQLLIGWVLEDDAKRVHEFSIKMTNLMRTKHQLAPSLLTAIPTTEGRLQIARAFNQGATVENLDAAIDSYKHLAEILQIATGNPDYSVEARFDWNAIDLKKLSQDLREHLGRFDATAQGKLRGVILGKNGMLTILAQALRDLSAEERRQRGEALNQFKVAMEALFHD